MEEMDLRGRLATCQVCGWAVGGLLAPCRLRAQTPARGWVVRGAQGMRGHARARLLAKPSAGEWGRCGVCRPWGIP